MSVLSPLHRRQVFAAVCCWALVALACSSKVAADDARTPPEGVRVFYTGHSFHMFVPPRVEQFVEAAGIQGHKLVGTQGIGGSRVIQHWDLADEKNKAKAALTSGEVDVFTMAAHVAIPDDGITNFTELGLNTIQICDCSFRRLGTPSMSQGRNGSATTRSAMT